MTFGSELKPNEFGAINGHIEKQLEVYGGLSKLLAEKAAAEKEYGRKVLELARVFQGQLATIYEAKDGAGIGSLALTEAEIAATTPLELLPAAHSWAVHLEEEGRLHVQLASKLSGDVADELRQAFDSLGDMRKRTLDFYQRLLAERDRAFDQKDKARAQYEACAKALAASRQKQERATTEKEQERHRQKADRDASARNQTKNEYILQVHVANHVKQAVNCSFTPRIMDSMQAIGEQRVATVKRLVAQMLDMQEAAGSEMVAGTQRAAHIVGRIAPDVDSAQFVRRRVEAGASSWEEPPDFRVVVDVASGESDGMVLDGESQVVLRNMSLQAQRESARAEQEAQEKGRDAEQARQRALAGGKGSERELEKATDAEREATLAELQVVQHQALRMAVEQQLGHIDSGSPHEFKAFTVAISKICDYCGESIGGLNRKAGKCAQCEYTCHAKCQIKVQPNCPGRDPEAKSGFLGMFGTRRGTKKGKGERQRSHSTASSDGSRPSTDANAAMALGAAQPNLPSLPPRQIQSQSQSQPQAQNQTQPQNHLGMLFNASSAGPSTASNSASQMSLGPRNSLSYGAAAMPRASISLLADSGNGSGSGNSSGNGNGNGNGNGSGSGMGSGPVSRSSTVNRTTGMAALVPTTSNTDSALVPMLYGFEGDNSTTLTVCAGDRVRVTEAGSDGSGWTEVVLGSGQQGLVPTSYIDMSAYRPTPQTVPAGRALMPPPILAQNHSPSAGPNNLSLVPATASSAEHVVALYDFAGRDTDELSFNAGDRIRVVSRDIGEGWLQGALGGREGRLPVSYVENA